MQDTPVHVLETVPVRGCSPACPCYRSLSLSCISLPVDDSQHDDARQWRAGVLVVASILADAGCRSTEDAIMVGLQDLLRLSKLVEAAYV